ncbi:AmmeMemoRadiSam system protein B [Rhizobium leguminosarum]|uniref:AmmeMemoRadiSam system protein B n=1 Tax=Rhizobium leguminosarum TaxID=384 RepID=UPI003F99E618
MDIGSHHKLIQYVASSERRMPWHLPFLLVAIAFIFLDLATEAAGSDRTNKFLALANDRSFLDHVIDNQRPPEPPRPGITGITVPHHLLAADLIAKSFWLASTGSYDRIILLSPDHFQVNRKPFSVAVADIETTYGRIKIDPSVSYLLSFPDFETLEPKFDDHGILAITPFVRRFFPDARIVAILGSTSSSEPQWLAAAQKIANLVTPTTLIIQSTDFSHYLPRQQSILMDQESINVISSENYGKVALLDQPGNLDSKSSQFIQMYIQKEINRSSPVIIDNRDSTHYGDPNRITTSYIAVSYAKDGAYRPSHIEDQKDYFFAGDFFVGRYFASSFRDRHRVTSIVRTLSRYTGSSPLILNLEGALIEPPLAGVEKNRHWMSTELASSLLQQLNVIAASLANNHAYDLGEDGFLHTQRNLSAVNITPLVHGRVADFGDFSALALTFLPTRDSQAPFIKDLHDLDYICQTPAKPPLIVFAHWGIEYTSVPTKIQEEMSERLSECGVSMIIGSHSHTASIDIRTVNSLQSLVVYSLGNFLFDQRGPAVSGAILHLRLFSQGTFSARLLSIPNIFDMMMK